MVGWTNPFENICPSNWIISPRFGVKITNSLKPTPSKLLKEHNSNTQFKNHISWVRPFSFAISPPSPLSHWWKVAKQALSNTPIMIPKAWKWDKGCLNFNFHPSASGNRWASKITSRPPSFWSWMDVSEEAPRKTCLGVCSPLRWDKEAWYDVQQNTSLSGWWLNQPIWKNMSQNGWNSSPK